MSIASALNTGRDLAIGNAWSDRQSYASLLFKSETLSGHLAGHLARRLKTLSGLTPYEYIAKLWTAEPERFIINPTHQMPGLNN